MTPLVQAPPEPRSFSHLSYSSVSTFQSCPLKWYFKYVLGLPVTTISSSLVFGSALHASVQYHFEQLLVGRQTTDLEVQFVIFDAPAHEGDFESRIGMVQFIMEYNQPPYAVAHKHVKCQAKITFARSSQVSR